MGPWRWRTQGPSLPVPLPALLISIPLLLLLLAAPARSTSLTQAAHGPVQALAARSLEQARLEAAPGELPGDFNYLKALAPAAVRPVPRAYHTAVVLDSGRGQPLMLVFGGVALASTGNYSAPTVVLDDLWAYGANRSEWVALPSSPRPSARAGHSAVVVGTDMAVFGGYTTLGDQSRRLNQDTFWMYHAAAAPPHWAELTAPNSPSPRFGAAMASQGGSVYLFGGIFGEGEPADASVYMYSEGAWSTVSVRRGQAPQPQAFAFSQVLGSTWVIASGSDANATAYPFSTEFDLASRAWSGPVDAPPLAAGASFVLAADGGIYTLGGTAYPAAISVSACLDRGVFAASTIDAWRYNAATKAWARVWTPALINQTVSVPAPRHGHTMVALGSTNLLFGGISTFSYTMFNDLWSVRGVFGSELWANPVDLKDGPAAKAGATWTPMTGGTYLFGGWASSEAVDGFWRYNTTANTWTLVVPEGRLPARRAYHAAFTLPPVGSRLFVFGGVDVNASGYFHYRDDLWVYDEHANAFAELASSPGQAWPAKRAGHSAAAWGDAVYVMGGKSSGACLDDLWRLEVAFPAAGSITATWVGMRASVRPPPRWGHRVFTLQGMLLAFGGRDYGRVFSDVWTFDAEAGVWEELGVTLLGPTPVRPLAFFSLATSGDAKALVYGGVSNVVQTGNPFVLSRADSFNYSSAVFEISVENRSLVWNRMAMDLDSNVRSRAGHVSALLQRPSAPEDVGRTATTSIYVWGGYQFDRLLKDLHVAKLGCNPGYYEPGAGFMAAICRPCAAGKFSESKGATMCRGVCPADTTTHDGVAATSIEDCELCVPNACNGHGVCTVGAIGNKISCHCDFSYRGSEFCDKPIYIIIVVVVATAAALIVILVQCSINRLGRLRRETETAYTRLDESQQEVAHLSEGWRVRPENLTLGRRIDRGCEGAWGEVYLGNWLGQKVAVKKLRHSAVMLSLFSDTVATNFEREIRVLRELRHRNIVFFYGAGTFDDNSPFLVTEYCMRGSLASILLDDRVALSWERKRHFALDAARGMCFLHGLNPARLHRDLKSANLLVMDDWSVKISDFGTAKLLSYGEGEEAEGGAALRGTINGDDATPWDAAGAGAAAGVPRNMTHHVGTVPYMSPEILLKQCYGPEADVYSFGVTLWEICTREEPFAGFATSFEIMTAAKSGERPALDANTPHALNQLIAICWDPSPLIRPNFDLIVRRLNALALDGC